MGRGVGWEHSLVVFIMIIPANVYWMLTMDQTHNEPHWHPSINTHPCKLSYHPH